jgi:3-hydroxy-9,10-secoandrosta-1,3,5(10)-triene-9,17-dione monooxygenase reductase component
MSDVRDPFATPSELRDPARRLRGRLIAPVTVWTAGGPPDPAGLTISSVIVAEGDPAAVVGVVNPTSDLWEAVRSTGAFVVHVLERRHRRVAELFAGRVPSPGGVFAALESEASRWGPVLTDIPNRCCCRLESIRSLGYQSLVEGVIEATGLTALEEPLAYFQGRYRAVEPRSPAERRSDASGGDVPTG